MSSRLVFNYGYYSYYFLGIYVQLQNKLSIVSKVPTFLCLSVGKGLSDIKSSPN